MTQEELPYRLRRDGLTKASGPTERMASARARKGGLLGNEGRTGRLPPTSVVPDHGPVAEMVQALA